VKIPKTEATIPIINTYNNEGAKSTKAKKVMAYSISASERSEFRIHFEKTYSASL